MRLKHPYQQGVTLIELMVVVALMALLAGLYLPAVQRVKSKGVQTRCLSNLRQLGLGFRLFADDHENQYPMELLATSGGTRDFISAGETWRHYQALSNYLDQPKLLICPADRLVAAKQWSAITNTNLSYFVGVDATFGKTTHFLSGDRNLAVDTSDNTNLVWLNVGENVSWTQEMHNANGNILFADNHVEMLGNDGLRAAVRRSLSTHH